MAKLDVAVSAGSTGDGEAPEAANTRSISVLAALKLANERSRLNSLLSVSNSRDSVEAGTGGSATCVSSCSC